MDEYFEILSKAVGEYVALVPIEQRDEARRWARKMKAERDKCHRVFHRVEIDMRKCITELEAENQRLKDALEQMTAERDSESRWCKEYLEQNTRLRELIKQVEWADDYCPWCERKYYKLEHSPSCPAFGEEGILKE